MGYRDEFVERQYRVMMLREQQKKMLREIADIIGFSVGTTRGLYCKAKLRQKRLYLNKIREVTGQSEQDMRALDNRLWKEFMDDNMTIAWLEREYKDILDAYRDGEPKSAYTIDENTPRPRKPHPRLNKKIPAESLRTEWKEAELLVLSERDRNGASFEEIGRLAGMSESQAYYTYRTAKLVQFRRYVKIISEKIGRPFEEIEKIAWQNDKRLHNRIAYLEKEYGGILE